MALEHVFRVNQEVGRIARSFAWTRPVLRDLQLEVNFTTIQIKKNRPTEAAEGLARASACLERVKAAWAVAPRGARDEKMVPEGI